MASSSAAQGSGQIFVGPGLSPFKRIMTVIGVLVVTALVLWIAIHEGLSAVGSTITAIIFIFGFVICRSRGAVYGKETGYQSAFV